MKNSWDWTGLTGKKERVGSTKSTGEPDAVKWFWKQWVQTKNNQGGPCVGDDGWLIPPECIKFHPSIEWGITHKFWVMGSMFYVVEIGVL